MRVLYVIISLTLILGLIEPTFATKAKARKKKSIPTKVVAVPAAIYGKAQLIDELNRMVSAEKETADIGVYVKSMRHGDTLYAHNINQALTPASTLKILTAEASLLYLGPEYKFSTQLLTDAKSVRNGILQGNLYIRLSGDPTLTYYDLVDLFLILKSHQIYAIQGNVYIDNTAYDQQYYGPGWDGKDKGYCYAAPISASIVNHNCISLQVAPAKVPGRPAQVVTSPKYFYPPIRNGVTTKAKGRGCGIHLSSNGSAISLEGCMVKGHYAWGMSYVVSEIQQYNLSLFQHLLHRLAINVYGKVTFGDTPGNLSLVGQHASKPLRLLINDMLKISDNIIAGALFKKLGQLHSKKPGSWQNGSAALATILSKQAGVNTSGMRALDGSGLSSDNLTTSAQLMQVLDFAYHHYPTSYEFIAALPIAGVDGTLKHRMGNIARKIRAKTGTISGVVSLAGYAVSGDKEPLAFVIMINGNKGLGWQYKTLEDKIATALTRYKRGS